MKWQVTDSDTCTAGVTLRTFGSNSAFGQVLAGFLRSLIHSNKISKLTWKKKNGRFGYKPLIFFGSLLTLKYYDTENQLTLLISAKHVNDFCAALVLTCSIFNGSAHLSTYLDMVDKKLEENIVQFCTVTGASYVQTHSSAWRSLLIATVD